jgi:spore maturation protein CgeB
MKSALSALLCDAQLARSLSQTGLRTILARHTSRHRVQELLAIVASITGSKAAPNVFDQQERMVS